MAGGWLMVRVFQNSIFAAEYSISRFNWPFWYSPTRLLVFHCSNSWFKRQSQSAGYQQGTKGGPVVVRTSFRYCSMIDKGFIGGPSPLPCAFPGPVRRERQGTMSRAAAFERLIGDILSARYSKTRLNSKNIVGK